MAEGSPRTFLPVSVVSREQTRRRVLLLGIGALTLLSTSPVLGHHLAEGADHAFLQGTDRIGALCLVALHLLLAPVHGVFHVLLLVGLAYGTWDRVRAGRRSRRVLAPLDVRVPAPGDAIWAAALDAGLEPRDLNVVAGLPNPAFTIGWLAPRIYVARELAQRLTRAQLTAVLAHEGAHVRRRDPLRLSVLRFFALTLFWLPALRRLADDVADEAEVQADDQAACHQPLVLASAILAVAVWSPRAPRSVRAAGAVGFACHDILERRVRRLAGEDTPGGTHLTRRSLAGAAAVLAIVWTSGVVVAHPLERHGAAAESQPNCLRHEGPALLHLLCDGISVGGVAHPCPHAST